MAISSTIAISLRSTYKTYCKLIFEIFINNMNFNINHKLCKDLFILAFNK